MIDSSPSRGRAGSPGSWTGASEGEPGPATRVPDSREQAAGKVPGDLRFHWHPQPSDPGSFSSQGRFQCHVSRWFQCPGHSFLLILNLSSTWSKVWEWDRAAEGSLLTPAPVSLLSSGGLSFPRNSAPAGWTPINMCKHWWVQPGAPPVLERTMVLESSVFPFLLQKGNLETDRNNYPFHLNYQEWNFFF